MAINSNKTGRTQQAGIRIETATFEKLKAYSDITGVPLGVAASRALAEWLEVTGAVHMEELAKKYSGKILVMPNPVGSAELTAEQIGDPLGSPALRTSN